MQSSATVACRVVVMLACLIVIPAAALFGTSLPGMVKRLLERRWPTGSVGRQEAGTEAPLFGSTGAAGTSGAGLAEGPQVDRFRPPREWPVAESAAAGVRRGRETPFEVTAGAGSAAGGAADREVVGSNLVPVQRPDRGAGLSPAGSGDRAPTSPPEAPPDRFTFIQQRLRELGATYYVLESWGDQGRLYRFRCRMPVAGSANYTRHFEATDADALTAMGKVLADVEAWRAGR